MVALAAISLVAALAVAPTAGAAGAGDGKAKSAATAKAKAAISKKRLNRKIKNVRRAGNALKETLATTEAALRSAITGGDKTIDDKINGIVGVVTPVLTQLGEGSLALKAGLEQLAAATTAGFAEVATNLTNLATFTQALEYGVTTFYTYEPGDDPLVDDPCCKQIAVMSSDIPDSGNTATASGELPISVSPTATPGDAPNAVLPDTKIAVGAAIKSNEADGAATGDPAGQVGGILMVTCAGGAPAGGCGDEGTPAGQPEFASGDLVCVVGPTESNTFPTPAGDVQQNLVNIQEKSSFTDGGIPGFDFGPSLVNPLIDAQTSVGTGDVNDGSCLLPSYGAYLVKLQMQFVDIPTSATPGPAD